MGKKIELLAPAGSMDAFYAAVKNGADAVYLGGKLFNARNFAKNFEIEDIKNVVRYAHIRNVKVYVTVNILISDQEFDMAINFIKELYLANVDGIIIQDIGLINIVPKLFKDLEIHASTQMTIYNKSGVEFLKKYNFSRVVLARETSLKEIQEVTKDKDIDVEIFGHGALCISYSGQCLLSSMIGGRSGNRGSCAQPCRMIYELIEEKNGSKKSIAKGHLLSPKDLCSIKSLKDLINNGVTSLKIEGRMKTAEYVAVVTKIYRKYIDNLESSITQQDMLDLTQIFNRGGFTDGYFKGYAPNNMITTSKPKNWGTYLGKVVSTNLKRRLVKVKLESPINMGDGIEIWNNKKDSPNVIVSQIILNGNMVKSAKANDIVELGYLSGIINKNDRVYKTSDKKQNREARATIDGKETIKRIGVNAYIRIKLGEKLYLKLSDVDGNNVEKYLDITPSKAINRPLEKERVIEQIKKTGNTPFYFMDIDVNLDDGVNIQISEINNIRRILLQELEDVRGNKNTRKIEVNFEDLKLAYLNDMVLNKQPKTPKISVFFYEDINNMPIWELNICRVYLPLFFINNTNSNIVLEKCRKNNIEVCLHVPSITRINYDLFIQNNIDKIREFDGVLCGNIGTMKYLKDHKIRVLCDYSFNIFNSNALNLLKKEDIAVATLSPELMLNQINDLKSIEGLEKEVIVYGNIPVMTSQYCIVGDLCGNYKKNECNGACKRGKYYLKDRKGELFYIKCDKISHRMVIFNSDKLFFGENINKIKGIDTIRLNILDEDFSEIKHIVDLHDRILSSTNEEDEIKSMNIKGYTKGHLFRGV